MQQPALVGQQVVDGIGNRVGVGATAGWITALPSLACGSRYGWLTATRSATASAWTAWARRWRTRRPRTRWRGGLGRRGRGRGRGARRRVAARAVHVHAGGLDRARVERDVVHDGRVALGVGEPDGERPGARARLRDPVVVVGPREADPPARGGLHLHRGERVAGVVGQQRQPVLGRARLDLHRDGAGQIGIGQVLVVTLISPALSGASLAKAGSLRSMCPVAHSGHWSIT